MTDKIKPTNGFIHYGIAIMPLVIVCLFFGKLTLYANSDHGFMGMVMFATTIALLSFGFIYSIITTSRWNAVRTENLEIGVMDIYIHSLWQSLIAGIVTGVIFTFLVSLVARMPI